MRQFVRVQQLRKSLYMRLNKSRHLLGGFQMLETAGAAHEDWAISKVHASSGDEACRNLREDHNTVLTHRIRLQKEGQAKT